MFNIIIPKARLLPSGKWFIRLRLNGKSLCKTFDTEDEAISWATLQKEVHRSRVKRTDYDKLLRGVWKNADIYEPKDKTNLPSVANEISAIDNMTGVAFEEYCSQLLLMTGYFNGCTISSTKKSNDFGADIVLTCLDGTRITIQCKRLNEKVRINAIQEVAASKNYYNADAAAVITNSHFTQSAKELAEKNGIALIDRKYLTKLVELKIKYMKQLLNHSQWQDFLNAMEISYKTEKQK